MCMCIGLTISEFIQHNGWSVCVGVSPAWSEVHSFMAFGTNVTSFTSPSLKTAFRVVGGPFGGLVANWLGIK